ncbi:hypothetical protein [Noviherbaspirillum sp. Root189]|uniref:hypothetical protein n=1 Tax=Noviherbaspirillum sp. Root189 TaxID=1736487 RepID=UPI0007105834|nr:hypothetical protein [Noviherbaspirillum sp. Root189]KRB93129.1 hypothetical protein ASE07_14260 [Noviherbaspirillum sp. Root189]
MNVKIADETRSADASGFHAEPVLMKEQFCQARLDGMTALMWSAMQEYALSLTALGAPGLHGKELQRREETCRDMRARFLHAKAAVETLSALKPASRPAIDTGLLLI